MVHTSPNVVDIEVKIVSPDRREVANFTDRGAALTHIAASRSDRPDEKIIVTTTEVFQ